MKDKIIIVGGYGQVGRIVSEVLAERYPGRVFAADVFHIEQVCDPLAIFERLKPQRYRFEFSDSAG